MIPGVIVGNTIDLRPALAWLAAHPGATMEDLLAELNDGLVGGEFVRGPYEPMPRPGAVRPLPPRTDDADRGILGPSKVVRLALL